MTGGSLWRLSSLEDCSLILEGEVDLPIRFIDASWLFGIMTD